MADGAATPGQVIIGLKPGAFASLGKVGVGTVEARKLGGGDVHLYWRFTLAGKTTRVPIGTYDSSAPPKSVEPTTKGYSIRAAFRAAEAMAKEHRDSADEGGYTALQERRRAERELAARTQAAGKEYTLYKLLEAYCDYLKGLGRGSHVDARSIFKLHVKGAWPKLADKQASEVTSEEIADVMRKLIESGKDRTANKLRSYVRAAFQVAKASRSKASIPVAFKSYGITTNPAADTAPDEAANRADKNPLNGDEMRRYWSAIQHLGGSKGAALRVHLLTGGQRIRQLVDVTTANVSADSILLFDGKGRPGKPARPHLVPLIPAAAKAMAALKPAGVYAMSTDGGETHLSPTTLANWAVEAAGTAEPPIEGFNAKRIRSGVETLLASARVSRDDRGRLQSHGVAGVQARHYDGHEYLDEKRVALETLHRLLEGKGIGNVVKMPAAKKAA